MWTTIEGCDMKRYSTMNVYVCIVVNETHAHKTTDIYAFKGGGYVYFNKILHVVHRTEPFQSLSFEC